MTFYRSIFKQAWELTWRNKYLWWLGIFAALLGNGGELEILFNNTGSNPGQALFPAWQSIGSTGVFSYKTWANIGGLFRQDTLNMAVFLFLILLILAVLLLLVWLVIVSQAAIVSGAAALIRQKKNSLKESWSAGRLNFWPVLALNIIIKAVVYILLIAISLPAIFFRGVNASIFYILALIVTVPVVIILSFIMKYAIAYAVINKMKIGQALRKSWQLFGRNWLVSFEMAIFLFFINLLVGLAAVLLILTLAVPFSFLGMIFYYALAVAGSWLIAALAFVGFILIVTVVGAALAVFQIASWTSLFLKLDKNDGASKLVRVVNSIIK